MRRRVKRGFRPDHADALHEEERDVERVVVRGDNLVDQVPQNHDERDQKDAVAPRHAVSAARRAFDLRIPITFHPPPPPQTKGWWTLVQTWRACRLSHTQSRSYPPPGTSARPVSAGHPVAVA